MCYSFSFEYFGQRLPLSRIVCLRESHRECMLALNFHHGSDWRSVKELIRWTRQSTFEQIWSLAPQHAFRSNVAIATSSAIRSWEININLSSLLSGYPMDQNKLSEMIPSLKEVGDWGRREIGPARNNHGCNVEKKWKMRCMIEMRLFFHSNYHQWKMYRYQNYFRQNFKNWKTYVGLRVRRKEGRILDAGDGGRWLTVRQKIIRQNWKCYKKT